MTEPSTPAKPEPSAAPWWAPLLRGPLPILPATHAALQDWHDCPDLIDAHLLTQTLSTDPLATLQLFRCVAERQRGRGTAIETVTEGLVLLGINPFLRAFPRHMPTTASWLAAHPSRAKSLESLVLSAQRRAQIALAFALYLQDPRAHHVYTAALLHSAGSLLSLLCDSTNNIAPSDGISWTSTAGCQTPLTDLHGEWRLPLLLRQLDDPGQSHLRGVRCADLAAKALELTAENDTGASPCHQERLTEEIREFLQCRRDELPQLIGLPTTS